jgi:hypothetical protein
MKTIEGKYAHNLYLDLLWREGGANTEVTVEGQGVHWRCFIERASRRCGIYFSEGPEYVLCFKRGRRNVADARTSSKEVALKAIGIWLSGATLPQLYNHCAVVDKNKRFMLRLEKELIRRVPELAAVVRRRFSKNGGSVFSKLVARQGPRSCTVEFYGNNRSPDAHFYWDKSEMFEFRARDRARLAAVLKRWVCAGAQPSEMGVEFPELKIGRLADYYEQGNPIEGVLIDEWDHIESFYKHYGADRYDEFQVSAFIAAMRTRGFDKMLCPGTSMWTLVLSRQHDHWTKGKSVVFNFEGTEMSFSDDGKKVEPRLPIALTPEIEAALLKLAAQKLK